MAARGLLIVLLMFTLPGCGERPSPDGKEAVTIAGESFRLTLAADPAAHEQGLMGVESIEPAGGMIFVFAESDVHEFWMGNCLTDMDILFVDDRGTITAVHHMKVEPPQRPGESDLGYDLRMPRYSSIVPVRFAIELAPGTVDRLGLRVNDRLDLDLKRLKALAPEADEG